MASADNPVITPHSYEEAFVPPRISYCMFTDEHVPIVNNLFSMFFNNHLDAILNKVILFYNFAESTFYEILCKLVYIPLHYQRMEKWSTRSNALPMFGFSVFNHNGLN